MSEARVQQSLQRGQSGAGAYAWSLRQSAASSRAPPLLIPTASRQATFAIIPSIPATRGDPLPCLPAVASHWARPSSPPASHICDLACSPTKPATDSEAPQPRFAKGWHLVPYLTCTPLWSGAVQQLANHQRLQPAAPTCLEPASVRPLLV